LGCACIRRRDPLAYLGKVLYVCGLKVAVWTPLLKRRRDDGQVGGACAFIARSKRRGCRQRYETRSRSALYFDASDDGEIVGLATVSRCLTSKTVNIWYRKSCSHNADVRQPSSSL
jgi:hypothetical protein